LDLLANRDCKKRMVRHQHSHRIGRRPREGFADECDLIAADAPILEGQRPRGVDAKDYNFWQLDERAQGLIDEAPISCQRRQEAPKHVVKRDIMVSRNTEHFMPALAQPFEKLACLMKLLGA